MAEVDNEEDFPGRLLHQAAIWGNEDLLEDLLRGELSQYLNTQDPRGRTALHAAATNDNETCTKILLQAGANPNIASGPDENAKTPLHIATEAGQLAVVMALTQNGADLSAKDSSGLTPVDLAEKFGYQEVMDFLKKAAKDL